MGRMRELHLEVPEIVIPQVVPEATARNVLTMEYVTGLTAERACSADFDQPLRDRWGAALFEFQFRGLLEHRFLHADPNLANFAFLEDGRIIVYDHGCVKAVPSDLAEGILGVVARRAGRPARGRPPGPARDGRRRGRRPAAGPFAPRSLPRPARRDPARRSTLCVRRRRRPLPDDLRARLRESGPGEQTALPRDLIFIDRSLAGHFGNLGKLRAAADWRGLIARYAAPAPELTGAGR